MTFYDIYVDGIFYKRVHYLGYLQKLEKELVNMTVITYD